MSQLANILADKGLLIATHNASKLKEISELLVPLDIDCVSAADKQLAEPEENGTSFAENAMIKSTAAAKASHMPALADDSGLVVPALDGDPGIYSARWARPGNNFSSAFNRIESKLKEKHQPLNSDAYFVCVLSLALPRGYTPHASSGASDEACSQLLPPKGGAFTITTAEFGGVSCINIEGRVYGTLCFPPRGDAGFGYDPIFIADGMQQTFAEISAEQKHQLSHRARAMRGLMEIIKSPL